MLIKRWKAKVVLLWGPGEESLVESITCAMEEEPVVAPRTSLKELACLISRCKLFIGSDSGPLHIASALSIPSIGLYGPTDPKRNGPYGTGNIAIRKDLSNLPCRRRRCRSCAHRYCMESIKVEDVVGKVEERIRELEVTGSRAWM